MANAILHCQYKTGSYNETLLECVQKFNDNAFFNGVVIPIIIAVICFIVVFVAVVLISLVDTNEQDENIVNEFSSEDKEKYGTH